NCWNRLKKLLEAIRAVLIFSIRNRIALTNPLFAFLPAEQPDVLERGRVEQAQRNLKPHRLHVGARHDSSGEVYSRLPLGFLIEEQHRKDRTSVITCDLQGKMKHDG